MATGLPGLGAHGHSRGALHLYVGDYLGALMARLSGGRYWHEENHHYPLKITMFNGKIHYKLPCSIAMLNYQRVSGRDDVFDGIFTL